MFLLDTNVISEVRKTLTGKADVNVVAWFSTVDAASLYLSCITVIEIERGILQMERRDRLQGKALRTWVSDYVLSEFADRILPVDTEIAINCAHLHVPDPHPERDAMIAATALVHRMTIVTRNVVDFERTGVTVLNPWEKH